MNFKHKKQAQKRQENKIKWSKLLNLGKKL